MFYTKWLLFTYELAPIANTFIKIKINISKP